MPALDDLPADQRAVLQLVLRQGRSYDDLARLLKVDRAQVRERARLGAETLTPAPRNLDAGDRGEIVDYMLGEDALGRGLLDESRPARVWARALAEDLGPLAKDPFPSVPAEPERGPDAEPAAAAAPAAEKPARTSRVRAVAKRERSSRLGGALLLAGIGIFIAVLVIVLISGNGDNGGGSSTDTNTSTSALSTPATTPTTTTGTGTTASAPTPLATVTLRAADGSKAVGVAQLLSQGSTAGFVVAAKTVRTVKGTYHGVWLTGPKAKPLFLGSVRNQDVRSGRISAVAPVPKNVRSYDTMLITQEPITSSKRAPSSPGQTVLSGALKVTGNLG